MDEDSSRRRLGRGLSALIGDIGTPPSAVDPQHPRIDKRIPTGAILPNPRNPRRSFGEEELAELAESIRRHGVVQPVVVRPADQPGLYEIVAGERRWRAARLAGLEEIPVRSLVIDDRTALEIAIVENVQRTDLNPIEEAQGYHELIGAYDYSQAELASVIGKSRSHVANTLRLLKLPQAVKDMLASGALSAGHARALVNTNEPETLAKRIVDEGLSVRQAEALAQEPPIEEGTAERARKEKDPDTLALEKILADATGLKVSIHHRHKGGELRVSYASLEQLDDLCRRLKG